jgi:manganese/iron transport system ATP-binding protein
MITNHLRKSKLGPRGVVHQPGAPILEIENLTVRFNGQIGLDGINLSIDHGNRVAVVGPNGAGKSTLFKVIAGIQPITSGRVKIAGSIPGSHICIAYIPQRTQVDWRFPVNVADVVMMGRIGKIGTLRLPSMTDWKIVHQSLDLVGLDDSAKRQIGELSGGQQQRMFIARALAQEAQLMLMDEPLTGLDLPSQDAIFDILDELNQRGVTLLVALHDLFLASERFERIALLNHRLIGYGTPQEVFVPDRLITAYGAHLHFDSNMTNLVAISETGCDEEV